VGAFDGINYTVVPILNVTADVIRTKINDRHGAFDMQYASTTITAGDISVDLSTDYYMGVINTNLCPYTSVKARTIINNGEDGPAVRMQQSIAGDKYYCEFDYMESDAGWTIYMEGTIAVECYFRGNRLVSASDCCIVATGTTLTIEGVSVYSTITALTGPDGIFHAEAGGLLIAKGCNISRAPGNTNGYDGLASGTDGTLRFIGSSYDSTKLRRLSASAKIKEWNGSSFVEAPVINNWAAGDAIVQSIVEDSTINFGSFTNCTITNSIVKNTTLTFTTNSQTIQNEVWISGVLVSPPKFLNLAYGANVSLTEPRNVLVGASGSTTATVNLPTANIAAYNTVTISDVGLDALNQGIDIEAGGLNLIYSASLGSTSTYQILTSGASVTLRLIDSTPGAYRWMVENENV